MGVTRLHILGAAAAVCGALAVDPGARTVLAPSTDAVVAALELFRTRGLLHSP